MKNLSFTSVWSEKVFAGRNSVFAARAALLAEYILQLYGKLQIFAIFAPLIH
jgi:hypothetical protein